MARPLCDQCSRPLRTCICSLVHTSKIKTKLTILQHPDELGHHKGTAQLLHLCLPESLLLNGLDFDEQSICGNANHSLLLYPDKKTLAKQASTKPPILADHLIVLDGTWRNTRELLLRNPWLQALPRCSLPGDIESRYRIRKAQAPHQLSTFEAACFALQVLENDTFPLNSMLASFEQFNGRIARFLPAKHHEENPPT